MRTRRAVFAAVILAGGVVLLATVLAVGQGLSDEARIARWADREVVKLVEPLEEFRRQFGWYPEKLFGPRIASVRTSFANVPGPVLAHGFPRPDPNYHRSEYIPLDLDEFILFVSVRHTPEGELALGSGPWETLIVLTGATGPVNDIPPFLGPELLWLREAKRIAASGRWSIWKPGPTQHPGPSESLTDYVAALAGDDPAVRASAASALGRVRSPESVPPLLGALGDPDATVRRRAAWALGLAGDARALTPLELAAKDPDEGVRRRSAWARARVGERLLFSGSGNAGLRPPHPFRDARFDFEGLPGIGRAPWLHLTRKTQAVITSVRAHDGARAVRLPGAVDRACGLSLEISPLPNRLAWQAAVFPAVAPGSVLQAGFVHPDRRGSRFFNRFELATLGDSKGLVRFRAGPTHEWVELGGFTPGGWTILRAVFDFGLGTVDLQVDGELRAGDVPVQPRVFRTRRGDAVQLLHWGVRARGGPAGLDDLAFTAH